ncbi:MAG TPA: bacteriohemerythrin [Bacteroides sp.]|nr:bacteriohemerythrin [Bacteroides sp.]
MIYIIVRGHHRLYFYVMVSKYTWKEEYNTGVSFIDGQHQYFLNIIRDLEDIIEDSVCKDSASKIFFSLVHYAEHFLIQEEIYFKDYHFPNLNEHKELHAAFIKRVIQFKTDYQMDIQHTCQTMLDYLVDWFENHILKYDKEAIEYLREKGL